MPWLKPHIKKGKHGLIYQFSKGVRVCLDADQQWRLYVEKDGNRYNKTYGIGKEALQNAAKVAESVSLELRQTRDPLSDEGTQAQTQLSFLESGKQWLKNNSGRWDIKTYQRYDEFSDCILSLLPNSRINSCMK